MTSTKKAGYTPGPWKLSDSVTEQGWPIVYAEGRKFGSTNLADKFNVYLRDPNKDCLPEELTANAKLIAKCPRMVRDLERLTLLVRNMKDVYGVKAAEWLIGQQAFKEAEQTLNELRDAGVIE